MHLMQLKKKCSLLSIAKTTCNLEETDGKIFDVALIDLIIKLIDPALEQPTAKSNQTRRNSC